MKRRMGDAATNLFKRPWNADAVVSVGKLPTKEVAPMVVTSIRIRRSQWVALHRTALARVGDGSSRPDVSAVLRSILDEWISANTPQP